MPLPLEICLEDLDLSPDDERYLHCVALPGDEPGLALDHQGLVRWMPDAPAAYGLWVSADDRLILLREAGAGPLTVQRGTRSVEAPQGKPVVLLDGDLLLVEGRRLQLHVHGVASEVHPPEPLTARALGQWARSATAALALGAMIGVASPAAAQPGGAAQAHPPVEVRRAPPKPAPSRRVLCSISSLKVEQGQLRVRASCPEKINVGAWGQLLDAQGKRVKDGTVIVRSVKGNVVDTEARSLKKTVKATQILFRAY